jgi:hypothetical protein
MAHFSDCNTFRKPPVKSYQGKVDKSWQNRERRGCHEEVEVFGEPDGEYLEGSRSWDSVGRSQPSARVQQSILLQMESQIWWDECQRSETDEGVEEENCRLKQMYANLSLEHEVLKDIIEKKLSK